MRTETIGQPMSCPHCATAIAFRQSDDGTMWLPEAIGSKWRVPRMLLVPGFALLLLGVASSFANGYVAIDSLVRPEAALEHARRQVAGLQETQLLTIFSSGGKKKESGDASPQEQFAAVAGQAARIDFEKGEDEKLAMAWSNRIFGVNAVFLLISLVMFAGSLCILSGKGYSLAIIGCIAAAANINNACCLPGFIVGAWGLLMLIRDEGRLHFGLKPNPAK